MDRIWNSGLIKVYDLSCVLYAYAQTRNSVVVALEDVGL